MDSPLSATPASADSDWPAKVTDRIESAVGAVRDRTTVPATTAARAVVYGVVIVVLAMVVVVLLTIALDRMLIVYLPVHPLARRVWVADAILSGIFFVIGAFTWRKRRPKSA